MKTNQIKGLEAFQKLKPKFQFLIGDGIKVAELEDIIEKNLKALEIIKDLFKNNKHLIYVVTKSKDKTQIVFDETGIIIDRLWS